MYGRFIILILLIVGALLAVAANIAEEAGHQRAADVMLCTAGVCILMLPAIVID